MPRPAPLEVTHLFPFAVYDTSACCMMHLGLYVNELECWRTFLGWPDESDIQVAKDSGLKVISVTVTYDDPLK